MAPTIEHHSGHCNKWLKVKRNYRSKYFHFQFKQICEAADKGSITTEMREFIQRTTEESRRTKPNPCEKRQSPNAFSGQTSSLSSVPNRSTDLSANRHIIGKGLPSFTTARHQLDIDMINSNQSTQSCPSLANIPRLDYLSSGLKSNAATNMDRSASCPMICVSSRFNSGINTDSSAINSVSSVMPSHLLSANWSSIEQCGTLATSSSSNVYPDSTSSVTVNNNFEQNGVCVPSTSFLETGVQNDLNESFLSLLNGPFVPSDQSTPNVEQLCPLDLMPFDVDEVQALVDSLNIVYTASSFDDVRSIVDPVQTVPKTLNFDGGRFIVDPVQSVPTTLNFDDGRSLVSAVNTRLTTSNFHDGRSLVDPFETESTTSLLPTVLEDFQDMETDG